MGNPDENCLDTPVMMLTSRYLVIFDARLNMLKLISTTDIMLPDRANPNPVVEGNCVRVVLSDGEDS